MRRFEIENSNLKIKIEKSDLYQAANMRIGKIAGHAEYRMAKTISKFPILGAKFGFSKLKNL